MDVDGTAIAVTAAADARAEIAAIGGNGAAVDGDGAAIAAIAAADARAMVAGCGYGATVDGYVATIAATAAADARAKVTAVGVQCAGALICNYKGGILRYLHTRTAGAAIQIVIAVKR